MLSCWFGRDRGGGCGASSWPGVSRLRQLHWVLGSGNQVPVAVGIRNSGRHHHANMEARSFSSATAATPSPMANGRMLKGHGSATPLDQLRRAPHCQGVPRRSFARLMAGGPDECSLSVKPRPTRCVCMPATSTPPRQQNFASCISG